MKKNRFVDDGEGLEIIKKGETEKEDKSDKKDESLTETIEKILEKHKVKDVK